MTDPYETLGVGREASADEIRIAFRRAASTAHPDKGGDTERMAAINEAYTLLSDPERRKRFDETGETKEQAPLEAEAISALADVFKKAIEQEQHGIIEFARLMTENTRQQIVRNRASAIAKKEKLSKKRMRVRVKGEAANLVHALIDAQIGAATKQVEALDRALLVADAVTKLLDAYEEDALAPEWGPTFSTFATGGWGG